MTERDTEAYEIGYNYGRADGSWTFDGNSDKTYAAYVLQGFEDGDPTVMDIQRSPLSGEWAGESISELSNRYGIDLEVDEVADSFEEGYSDGFWWQVQHDARALVG